MSFFLFGAGRVQHVALISETLDCLDVYVIFILRTLLLISSIEVGSLLIQVGMKLCNRRAMLRMSEVTCVYVVAIISYIYIVADYFVTRCARTFSVDHQCLRD
jgi:hypothetical protein